MVCISEFPTLETESTFVSYGGPFVATLSIKAYPGFTEENVKIAHNSEYKEYVPIMRFLKWDFYVDCF